ncbi:MAG: hypothetical protein AAFY76_09025 [Cyanobacteria bacterium J06649_11]
MSIMNESRTNTLPVTSNILNRRYQYAVGLFLERQYLENALKELQANEFPMHQVTIVSKNTINSSYITDIKISTSQYYHFANFDIADEVARNYNYQIALGNYLIVLRGTAILIAAARNILQSRKIQHFATFNPSILAGLYGK